MTALNDLIFDSFEVSKVLVIAPLRVARDTWPAELKKWDHLKNLRYSVAVGTEAERKAALRASTERVATSNPALTASTVLAQKVSGIVPVVATLNASANSTTSVEVPKV